MDAIDARITFFQNMVQCCFPVEFWEYDENLNLLSERTEENELMYYFFRYSTAFSSLQEYLEKGNTHPALVHAREGLYWIADFALNEQARIRRIFIMGPFAMTDSARQQVRQKFQSAEHPLEIHRRLTETLNKIPLIPAAYMFQYAIMYHYAISEEKISVSDIQHPFSRIRKEEDIFAYETENDSDKPGNHSGVWQAEQQLMQAVQTGNLNYSDSLTQVSMRSNGVRTRDPGSLRSNKDSIILFVGLCSRAAIAGGLPPEIAYDMCDRYVDMAESTESAPELQHVSNLMLEDYIRKVHAYQTNSSTFSRPIQICCDYIHMHVTEDLSLENLAKVCGYTDYYLSRKFKKETGTSIGEYILHAKLDQACLLLKTTSYAIQDISDSLSFSSRSYFSTAFQKYKGISPKEYREKS